MSAPLPSRRAALAGLAAAPVLLAATPLLAAPGDAEIASAYRALLTHDAASFDAALATLEAHGAPDVAAGLILAMRYARQPKHKIDAALSRLTGETGREGWFDWMLWQEAHPEIAPHPTFTAFKRDLFLRIDQRFEILLKPEHLERDRMRIRFEEITWGGVPLDGIPSLDDPTLIAAAEAGWLSDDELVFGVEIEGDARAYPQRIMDWHEMFNDVIGGVPLALAYCTLCGAGILYETLVDGREERFLFGSSGFLYRSNKLMFDRQTLSLWNQFTGEPVVGPLADSGIRLRQRPVAISSWKDWRRRHPETRVLSRETGHIRDYRPGAAYSHYFDSPELMFPAAADESRLAKKALVFGVRVAGAAKAWPLEAFSGGRVLNDRVGGLSLVLVGDAATRTVRAYDRGGRVFDAGATPDRLVSEGQVWRVTEDALIAPDGARAPRVAGHVAYWFAWDSYLGARSELYGG